MPLHSEDMRIGTRTWVEVVLFGIVLTVLAELMTRLWSDFFPNRQVDRCAVVWVGVIATVALLCVAIIRKLRGARRSK